MDTPGLERLALAVLRQAFDDAALVRPPTRALLARGWLESESAGLQLWASLAGVSLREIRRRLHDGRPAPTNVATSTATGETDEQFDRVERAAATNVGPRQAVA